MDTFPITYGPDWDQGVTPAFKVLETEFGDGYTQGAIDGLNNVKETWDLKWTSLTPAECLAAYNFLKTAGGVIPFLWLPPYASVYSPWKCKVVTMTPNDPGGFTLAAKFEQAITQ